MKVAFKEIKGIRIVSSGTTVIPLASTVTLDTKTINPGEVVFPAAFINNNVNNAGWGEGDFLASSPDHINVYFRRTGTANEIKLLAQNNGASGRTIQWAIIAIQL